MAKLNRPLFSLSALGAIGKSLVIRGQGKSRIIGQRAHPRDARTFAQLTWRTMYQKAVALWHQLSPAEKQDWERQATPRHMTGFAYFISQALKPNPGIYLPLAGGVMTGDIDLTSHQIINLSASNPDFLAELFRGGNSVMIPTAAGWATVTTGAGNTRQEPMRNLVEITDVNVGSELAHMVCMGFNIGGNYGRINFDKHFFLIFNYAIYNSEANLNRRVQIESKSPPVLGLLTAMGVGFQATHLVMTGEAYGTARGTVGLGNMVLVGGAHYEEIQVIIEIAPATPAVNFYIDGALAGSITNVNHIPSGEAPTGCYMKHSIDRPGGGVANVASVLFHGKAWQEF